MCKNKERITNVISTEKSIYVCCIERGFSMWRVSSEHRWSERSSQGSLDSTGHHYKTTFLTQDKINTYIQAHSLPRLEIQLNFYQNL